MTRKHLSILLIFLPLYTLGQSFSEKLMLTDSPDSSLLKAKLITFDQEGNYFIQQKNEERQYRFIQNQDTIGPLKLKVGAMIAKYISLDSSKQIFYRTPKNRLWGPLPGEDMGSYKYPLSKNGEHFALPVLLDDKIVIYFDGEVIHEIDTISGAKIYFEKKKMGPLEAKKHQFESDDWMYISNSGNYIYSLENELNYTLYLNGTPIDSSLNDFSQLKVNDQGDYLYAKGRKPREDEPYTDNYMFFLHTQDSVFGPVRTAWNSELKKDGAYYYTADDDGPDYILINNQLFRDVYEVENIRLLDKDNFLFTYKRNDSLFINVNGKSYFLDYEKIYYPNIDEEGNFALYGLRDYYLYKFVNGEEIKEAITNYGVRPTPLYIDPLGESLHIFKTDDSVYLYREDTLLFPALVSGESFSFLEAREFIFLHKGKMKPHETHSLFGLNIRGNAYMVFKGALSQPLLPLQKLSWMEDKPIGEIIAGGINEQGFFAIQKLGDDNWLLNVNNTHYHEFQGADRILYYNCFFDGHKLIFYGLKGLSFYQFTFTL